MQKIKRIIFKYIRDRNTYVVLKVQNIKGFKPQQELNQIELDKLDSTDIEVIVK